MLSTHPPDECLQITHVNASAAGKRRPSGQTCNRGASSGRTRGLQSTNRAQVWFQREYLRDARVPSLNIRPVVGGRRSRCTAARRRRADVNRPTDHSFVIGRTGPADDQVTVRAVRLDGPHPSRRPARRRRSMVAWRRSPISSSRSRRRDGRPPRRPRRGSCSTSANLYIAARCWDSHPEREVANELRRDNGNILGNENVTFVIDTFHDRRNGYLFQTNPLGALRDMTVTDDLQNSAWNGIWTVKTAPLRAGLDDGGRDSLQDAPLSRQRPADLGHQPAPAGEVEERVLVPVAGAGGARHRRRQPDGLGGDDGRPRDAGRVEEPRAEALRGGVGDDGAGPHAGFDDDARPTPASTSSTA